MIEQSPHPPSLIVILMEGNFANITSTLTGRTFVSDRLFISIPSDSHVYAIKKFDTIQIEQTTCTIVFFISFLNDMSILISQLLVSRLAILFKNYHLQLSIRY